MIYALFAVARMLLILWLVYSLNRTSGWLRGAHARRKKVERILRRQQARYDLLLEENVKLEKLYRALAAELTDEILTAQDREAVTKGLTRKIG